MHVFMDDRTSFRRQPSQRVVSQRDAATADQHVLAVIGIGRASFEIDAGTLAFTIAGAQERTRFDKLLGKLESMVSL